MEQINVGSIHYVLLIDFTFSKDEIKKLYIDGMPMNDAVVEVLDNKMLKRQTDHHRRSYKNARRAAMEPEDLTALLERKTRFVNNIEFNRMVRAQEAYDKENPR